MLVRILFAVYLLLIVYASLHPFSGWRHFGISPLDYLFAPWPRNSSGFDVAVNVIGYSPFGFLCVALLHPRPRLRGAPAFAIAVLGASALSITLEALQNYLPTRFASNLDVLANVSGAAAGALAGLAFAPWLLHHGPFRRLRNAAFLPGTRVDIGLVLIGLWLFIQLNPITLLFGSGDLRDLVVPPGGRPRAPEFFVSIEAVTSAANLVVVALLLSALIAERRAVRPAFLGLVAAALVIKAGAFALLTRGDPFAWLTVGAQEGLAGGIALGLGAVALPRTVRLTLAAVLTMAATVLVNLAPANPYFTATLRLWHQGHFLNFNGLTRLVSASWPFVVLGYLFFLASRRGREAER
jgi:VanZ family protein